MFFFVLVVSILTLSTIFLFTTQWYLLDSIKIIVLIQKIYFSVKKRKKTI